MSFRIIKPLTINDAILTSSSIPEPDTGEVAWNIATVYALGTIVYQNHIMYEALTNGESGNNPSAEIQNDVDNPPTKWLEIGRTNRWKMFDLLRTNKSIGTSPLTFTLTAGERINSFGMFGLVAEDVTITMVSGATTVYSRTFDLNSRVVNDFYDYFYEPFTNNPTLIVFDLPPIKNGVVTVTITNTSGSAEVGSVVVGNFTNIGQVLYGAESDVLNFSRIDRAFDGTALLRQRRSIPKINVQVIADKARTNKIRDLRTELNAIPAVYAGIDQTDDDYFESLLILGIYKKWTIKLDHPTSTVTEIEVEEI